MLSHKRAAPASSGERAHKRAAPPPGYSRNPLDASFSLLLSLPMDLARWLAATHLNRWDRRMLRCVCKALRTPLGEDELFLEDDDVADWRNYNEKLGAWNMLLWMERHYMVDQADMRLIVMNALQNDCSSIYENGMNCVVPTKRQATLMAELVGYIRTTVQLDWALALQPSLTAATGQRYGPRWLSRVWQGALATENVPLLDRLHAQAVPYLADYSAATLTKGLKQSYEWLRSHHYLLRSLSSTDPMPSAWARELQQGGMLHIDLCDVAIQNNDLELLQYGCRVHGLLPGLEHTGLDPDSDSDADSDSDDEESRVTRRNSRRKQVMHKLLRSGCLHLLDWYQTHVWLVPMDAFEWLVSSGSAIYDLATFRWLMRSYTPVPLPHFSLCTFIVRSPRASLEWLKAAHEEYLLPLSEDLRESVMSGHAPESEQIRILEWLLTKWPRVNGVGFESALFWSAFNNHSVELLEWMRQAGIIRPGHISDCSQALMRCIHECNGTGLAKAKWLLRHGFCEPSAKCFYQVLRSRECVSGNMLRLLHQHGCPWRRNVALGMFSKDAETEAMPRTRAWLLATTPPKSKHTPKPALPVTQ
jgi:hypothetical protein